LASVASFRSSLIVRESGEIKNSVTKKNTQKRAEQRKSPFRCIHQRKCGRGPKRNFEQKKRVFFFLDEEVEQENRKEIGKKKEKNRSRSALRVAPRTAAARRDDRPRFVQIGVRVALLRLLHSVPADPNPK